jgi:hypothetical protein
MHLIFIMTKHFPSFRQINVFSIFFLMHFLVSKSINLATVVFSKIEFNCKFFLKKNVK